MTPELLDMVLQDCAARKMSPTQWVSTMRPAVVSRLRSGARDGVDPSGVVGAVALAILDAGSSPSYFMPELRRAIAARAREIVAPAGAALDKRKRPYWIVGRVWVSEGESITYTAPAPPLQIDGMQGVASPAIWLFQSVVTGMRPPWGDWFQPLERRARVALSADGSHEVSANSPDNTDAYAAGVHVTICPSQGTAIQAHEAYQRDHAKAPYDAWAMERGARVKRMGEQLGRLSGRATVELLRAPDAAAFDAAAQRHHDAGTLLHVEPALSSAWAKADSAPAEDKPAFPVVQPVDEMRTTNLEWSPEDA